MKEVSFIEPQTKVQCYEHFIVVGNVEVEITSNTTLDIKMLL